MRTAVPAIEPIFTDHDMNGTSGCGPPTYQQQEK
jgi:hypothetical protein